MSPGCGARRGVPLADVVDLDETWVDRHTHWVMARVELVATVTIPPTCRNA
ncbi:hypothetical protein [Nonomuraea polychroma]|uniref:hypothetical protein n=1 Tax=Nonomuraea polychroma TaxID=46176 RepID=UPI0013E33947|nr:hypothetical protein [Nonomuraea polychroma]